MALSEEDRALAQSLSGFAQGLRRGNERQEGFDQRNKELSFGANIAKQQSEQRFSQEQQTLGQRQDFSAEQSALGRESSERIASLRGPETKINIQIDQEKVIKEKSEQLADLEKSGLITTEIVTDSKGNRTQIIVESNLEELGKANAQGRYLRNRILTLMDETRDFTPGSINEGIADLLRQLQDIGVKSPAVEFAKVRKEETREKYVKRLKGFRESIIRNEITSRLKTIKQREPFFVKTNDKKLIKFREDNVIRSIMDEFGGDLE